MAKGPEAIYTKIVHPTETALDVIRQVDELIEKADQQYLESIQSSENDDFSPEILDTFTFSNITTTKPMTGTDSIYIDTAFRMAGWDEVWVHSKPNPIDKVNSSLVEIVLIHRFHE